MDKYRDQVISLVMTEEIHFSTPIGIRGSSVPNREFGSSPFGRPPTQDAPPGPPTRSKDSSELQMALLSLGRQLSGPAGTGLAAALPPGAPQGMAAGARFMTGNRKVPQDGVGSKDKKVTGDFKLFHYDIQNRHQIWGGRCESFLRCHHAVLHTTRRFSTDWKTELITSLILGGGHGAGSSQEPRALLEPSIPKTAAEYSVDNLEVLAAENSMQGWLSLFWYLIEAEERGDNRAPNPALMEFAARARTSVFATPLSNHTKQARDDDEEASKSSHSRGDKPPDFTALKDAIMGVQGAAAP